MRPLRVAGKLVLALVLAFLVIEVSFRLAGALSPWPGDDGIPRGDRRVVLCIGDSHTWGLGRGYPARLGELLADRPPGYHVINLGVAGSNTAQVRTRLDGYLDRFQPSLVVLWAGINNKYNRADSEVWSEADVEEASLLRQALDSSRVLRFVRVWMNERELSRLLEDQDAYIVPETGRSDTKYLPGRIPDAEKHRRKLFGQEDVFEVVRKDKLPPDEMTRVTELDMRWIAERIRGRGIPVVAITYPFEGGWFGEANAGIRAAAAAAGVPVVESVEAVRRLKAKMRARGEKFDNTTFFDPSVHPRQVLYDAIGDLVVETVDREGLLGPAPPAASPSAGVEPR